MTNKNLRFNILSIFFFTLIFISVACQKENKKPVEKETDYLFKPGEWENEKKPRQGIAFRIYEDSIDQKIQKKGIMGFYKDMKIAADKILYYKVIDSLMGHKKKKYIKAVNWRGIDTIPKYYQIIDYNDQQLQLKVNGQINSYKFVENEK